MTGLVDPLSARSVTTCQGGLAACKFVRVRLNPLLDLQCACLPLLLLLLLDDLGIES